MKIPCRGLVSLGYRLVNARTRKRNPENSDLFRHHQQTRKPRTLAFAASRIITRVRAATVRLTHQSLTAISPARKPCWIQLEPARLLDNLFAYGSSPWPFVSRFHVLRGFWLP